MLPNDIWQLISHFLQIDEFNEIKDEYKLSTKIYCTNVDLTQSDSYITFLGGIKEIQTDLMDWAPPGSRVGQQESRTSIHPRRCREVQSQESGLGRHFHR